MWFPSLFTPCNFLSKLYGTSTHATEYCAVIGLALYRAAQQTDVTDPFPLLRNGVWLRETSYGPRFARFRLVVLVQLALLRGSPSASLLWAVALPSFIPFFCELCMALQRIAPFISCRYVRAFRGRLVGGVVAIYTLRATPFSV